MGREGESMKYFKHQDYFMKICQTPGLGLGDEQSLRNRKLAEVKIMLIKPKILDFTKS